MKKGLALLLALVMCLTFAACGETERVNVQYPQNIPQKDQSIPSTSSNALLVEGTETEEVSAPEASRSESVDVSTEKTEQHTHSAGGDEAVVEAYVEENEAAIIQSFAQTASTSGQGYKTTVKAVGTGIVVDMYMDYLNYMPDDFSATLQATYDSLQSIWDLLLLSMQEEAPEITYYTFNVLDGTGRKMAVVHAGE